MCACIAYNITYIDYYMRTASYTFVELTALFHLPPASKSARARRPQDVQSTVSSVLGCAHAPPQTPDRNFRTCNFKGRMTETFEF